MNDAEDRFYVHIKTTFLRGGFVERGSNGVYRVCEKRRKSDHPEGVKRRTHHQRRKPS